MATDKPSILAEFYKKDAGGGAGYGTSSGGLPVGWSPDPSKYHDIGAVVVADGVPMSGRFPGAGIDRSSRGGTIIPRHVPGLGGGSMGWTPQSPIDVYVDEGLTEKPIKFNTQRVTKNKIERAIGQARNAGLSTFDDVGAAAYAYIASDQSQYEAETASTMPQQPAKTSARPVSLMGVAAGTMKAAQAEAPAAAPAVAPPSQSSSPYPSVPDLPPSILGEMRKPVAKPRVSTVPHEAAEKPVKPLLKVVFEFPPPVKWFPAHYHAVVYNEQTVLLVYDRRCGGTPWFPAVPPPPSEGEEDDESSNMQIGVMLYDHDGRPDTSFAVLQPVVQYSYEELDFCLFPLVAYRSHKEANNGQQT